MLFCGGSKQRHARDVAVWCVLAQLFVQLATATDCTQNEVDLMQAEITKCTGEATSVYQTSLLTVDVETATCKLFSSLVDDCGVIWEKCHTHQDISEMKMMQMRALVNQYIDSEIATLEDCQITKDYWDALEADNYDTSHDDDKCSEKQFMTAQNNFQTCSHEISTTVFQSFYEVSGSDEVATLVCEALGNISRSCPDFLAECFAPGDVRQMLRMHLKNIATYLTGLSDKNLTQADNTTINNCPALVEMAALATDLEYFEYSDQVTEPADVEDNARNIQDILSAHEQDSPADQPAADREEPTPPVKEADRTKDNDGAKLQQTAPNGGAKLQQTATHGGAKLEHQTGAKTPNSSAAVSGKNVGLLLVGVLWSVLSAL